MRKRIMLLGSTLLMVIAVVSIAYAAVPNVEQAKLTASNVQTDALLGRAVAAGADAPNGPWIFAGAQQENLGSNVVGAVYIYERVNGTDWAEIAHLLPINVAEGRQFGRSIGLDGTKAIISFHGYYDPALGISGAADVYEYINGNWQFATRLTDGVQGNQFGYAVAIHNNRIVAGAPKDDDIDTATGAAYVYEWDANGTSWIQTAKLYAADAYRNDFFGTAVDISNQTIVVGVPDDDDYGSGSGSVYIFEKVNDQWQQQVKLTSSDLRSSVQFGNAVAIRGDYLVIGAYMGDGNVRGSGAAYVFKRTAQSWHQIAKIFSADGERGEWYGQSVSVQWPYIAVGAPKYRTTGKTGSVFLYEINGDNVVEVNKIVSSDANVTDNFGWGVSIAGNVMAAGAPGDSDMSPNAGAVYAFGTANP